MAERDFKRKLSAVFSADVAGYSRLMCREEGSTVMTLHAYGEVMSGLVEQHRGRVVDSPGDNLLAEFESVVAAVECAVEVQKELGFRNAGLPEDRRMRSRIGINLGDVIEEGGRLYGTGVNLAARLESMADPGGICISRTVLDHVQDLLPLGYEYLGKHAVKNICREVEVFRVLMDPIPAGEERTVHHRENRAVSFRKAFFAAMVLLVTGGAVWLSMYTLSRASFTGTPNESGSPPAVEDRPSIAVLPFANLSGDPEQDYFSDGITEDIITALSVIPRMRVIARNSTFTFKGTPVNVQQVGRELGVRYVLEGSIQKDGDRVRITTQLIDASTGVHLWAERYDRPLKEVFALQDEITLHITRAIQTKLGDSEHGLIRSKAPVHLDAYMKVLKGQSLLMESNVESNARARQLFEEATLLDPDYPAAYTALARTYLRDVWFGRISSAEEDLGRAMEFAERALRLDESEDPGVHALLSQIHLLQKHHEEAIAEGERAVAITPNSTDGYCSLGMSLYYSGRFEEAIAVYEKSLRLDPTPSPWFFHNMANAFLMTGRYAQAIDLNKKALARNPESLWAHLGLAAAYGLSGHDKEARETAARILRSIPLFSPAGLEAILPYRNQSDKDRFVEALRKAGLYRGPSTPLDTDYSGQYIPE